MQAKRRAQEQALLDVATTALSISAIGDVSRGTRRCRGTSGKKQGYAQAASKRSGISTACFQMPQRRSPRGLPSPRFGLFDRLFWVWLSRRWPGWHGSLVEADVSRIDF